MELLIVRHAIAHERDPTRWGDDRARPLTAPGIKRARRAAAGLKQLIAPPERVLTSPLTRAEQTAQLLREAAGWPQAKVCALLAPGGSPAALLALLALLAAERIARAAIVGHQPDLGKLLALCLPGPADAAFELRKMGVALVSFAGAPRAGRGTLQWLVAPRLLRAVGAAKA